VKTEGGGEGKGWEKFPKQSLCQSTTEQGSQKEKGIDRVWKLKKAPVFAEGSKKWLLNNKPSGGKGRHNIRAFTWRKRKNFSR